MDDATIGLLLALVATLVIGTVCCVTAYRIGRHTSDLRAASLDHKLAMYVELVTEYRGLLLDARHEAAEAKRLGTDFLKRSFGPASDETIPDPPSRDEADRDAYAVIKEQQRREQMRQDAAALRNRGMVPIRPQDHADAIVSVDPDPHGPD